MLEYETRYIMIERFYLALVFSTRRLRHYMTEYSVCHAPIPGPTRLADPNQVSRRETIYWDFLPDFFFLSELNL